MASKKASNPADEGGAKSQYDFMQGQIQKGKTEQALRTLERLMKRYWRTAWFKGKRDELVALRKPENLGEQCTSEVCRERYSRCQQAIRPTISGAFFFLYCFFFRHKNHEFFPFEEFIFRVLLLERNWKIHPKQNTQKNNDNNKI